MRWSNPLAGRNSSARDRDPVRPVRARGVSRAAKFPDEIASQRLPCHLWQRSEDFGEGGSQDPPGLSCGPGSRSTRAAKPAVAWRRPKDRSRRGPGRRPTAVFGPRGLARGIAENGRRRIPACPSPNSRAGRSEQQVGVSCPARGGARRGSGAAGTGLPGRRFKVQRPPGPHARKPPARESRVASAPFVGAMPGHRGAASAASGWSGASRRWSLRSAHTPCSWVASPWDTRPKSISRQPRRLTRDSATAYRFGTKRSTPTSDLEWVEVPISISGSRPTRSSGRPERGGSSASRGRRHCIHSHAHAGLAEAPEPACGASGPGRNAGLKHPRDAPDGGASWAR